MSFGICAKNGSGRSIYGNYSHNVTPVESMVKILTCYTPCHNTIQSDTVSLVSHPSNSKCVVSTNPQLAIVPTNAIIDKIEYNGISFNTKGAFCIGLGQLNHSIMFPLIENGTVQIANDKPGGSRDFISINPSGQPTKTLVLYPSNVNIVLEDAIISGNLRVDITYHIKH